MVRPFRAAWWEHLINAIVTFVGAWVLTKFYPELSYLGALLLMVLPVWILLYWCIWHHVNGDDDSSGSDSDGGGIGSFVEDLLR